MSLWQWSVDTNVEINFCVWALVVDGLKAAPFDAHGDGDARLREAGLEREGWGRWLETVVRETPAAGEVPGDAAVHLFGGPSDVAARLAGLLPAYRPVGREYRRLRERSVPALDGPLQRRVWRQLSPFRRTLPPLRVFVVGYSKAVVREVRPEAIVVGDGAGSLEPPTFANLVLEGARRLAS
jgi:hypothetical protein